MSKNGLVGGGLSLIGGVGVGALLMYLFDPKEGDRRRQNLSESAGGMLQTARGSLASNWDSLAEHASALGHTLASQAHDARDKLNISHLSQNLADHARKIGQSVSDHTTSYASQASDIAGRAGDVASDYSSKASGYASQARDYAGGLLDRARARFAPEQESHAAGYGITAASALVLGVSAMYLLDPEKGRDRRDFISEKLVNTLCSTGQMVRRTGRYVREQADCVVSKINNGHLRESVNHAVDSIKDKFHHEDFETEYHVETQCATPAESSAVA